MTDEERLRLNDRFHALSFVCWCCDGADPRKPESLCSACREQVGITAKLRGEEKVDG